MVISGSSISASVAVIGLAEIVRRNVGGHADGDAGRAIDQQVRNPGRHDRRFSLGTVVVRNEIDGVLVDVCQQFAGDARHPDFGVAHGGRRVAVHGTEVALPVHQQVAHRERLGHAHDGVVDRRVAVRVVLADDVADDAGGLLVGLGVVVAQFPHGVQDPPVHGLQAVPHVRQGATHDDAHGVVQIGLTHLVFEVYRENFLGDFSHRSRRFRMTALRWPARSALAVARPAGGSEFRRCGVKYRVVRMVKKLSG